MANILLIKGSAAAGPYVTPSFSAVVRGDDFTPEDAAALKDFCTGEALVLVVNSTHTVEFN